MSGAAVLVAERIGKTFPGVRALQDVDFDVRVGEIHALLGQNGAGKSTLMNILAGVIPHDAGHLIVNGSKVTIDEPKQAQALGISIVHQELSLFPSRSVAENIFVGRPPDAGGFIRRKKLLDMARAALDEMEIHVDPDALVRDLPFSQQQLIEIAKALSFGGRILILDEPTSALTEHESAVLFRRLERLRAAGMGIIYVSHRLREVFALSDRITILRDGRLIGTFETKATTPAEVIGLMVNRKLASVARPEGAASADARFVVRGLSVAPTVKAINFEIRRGEILGLAGLAGAGQTEVGRALCGLLPRRADAITLDGSPYLCRRPSEAMRAGVVYLPADRRVEGLFLGLSVEENIVASSLRKLGGAVWVRDGQAREAAGRFVQSLAVRTPSIDQTVAKLSGGNQQKVVLARSLMVDARVFIADEPTRGIDVGAKAEIYALFRRLAEQGKSILLISTELPEIIAISDRILVIAGGRIVASLSGDEASEDRILTLSSTALNNLHGEREAA
ncbi:MAG: sugar ABC transporter ATP-binding protein [Hyphomicrobiales bacterium]|nr:sugar ABC transporter ATP-binding protein [Hyphomicrobiales bacterium]